MQQRILSARRRVRGMGLPHPIIPAFRRSPRLRAVLRNPDIYGWGLGEWLYRAPGETGYETKLQ